MQARPAENSKWTNLGGESKQTLRLALFFPAFKLSLLQTWTVFNEWFSLCNSAAEISSIFMRNAHKWHNRPAQSTGRAPLIVFRQARPKATWQPSHHAHSPLHQQLCPSFGHSSWPQGNPTSGGTAQACQARPEEHTQMDFEERKTLYCYGSWLQLLRPCLPVSP